MDPRGKEVYLHKIEPVDKINEIIQSYYNEKGNLASNQLNALRKHVYQINSKRSNISISPCGSEVRAEPQKGEFLILPSENTLNACFFYNSSFNPESINGFVRTDNDFWFDFAARAEINQFQQNVDPLAAIAFCEITDGLCNKLSEKEYWKGKLNDYTSDYFKELGVKLGEHGAEFYATVNQLEGLLLKYGSSEKKVERQTLKAEIKVTHKEMTKQLPEVMKKYIKQYASSNAAKSLVSSNKAMDSADLYAKNGRPRAVILKDSYDRWLKFVKFGKHLPAIGNVADFIAAQYGAYTAYNEGKDWQRELFIKDAGVLAFMVAGEAVGLIVGAVAGIPFLVGVGIAVVIAGQSSDYFEKGAELFYEKFLQ